MAMAFKSGTNTLTLRHQNKIMKHLSFVLTFVLAVACSAIAYAQNEGADGPVLSFENMIVDYGKIVQNSDPLRVVKFTNTGTEPLVIQNARGSCGCTVPSFPKQPIMPGESSEIEIRYDSKRLGKINKTVTITTNEGGEPHVLKVTGQIEKLQQEDGVPPAKNGLIKPGKSG